MAALVDHFNKVIIETMILNLSDDQLKEFEKVVKENPQELEQKVAEMAANVPGLMGEIEKAVQEEILALKLAKESIK